MVLQGEVLHGGRHVHRDGRSGGGVSGEVKVGGGSGGDEVGLIGIEVELEIGVEGLLSLLMERRVEGWLVLSLLMERRVEGWLVRDLRRILKLDAKLVERIGGG